MKTKQATQQVNKSEAIRQCIREGYATVGGVIETLRLRGIRVKPGLVYLVRSQDKAKARRRKIERRHAKLVANPIVVNSQGEVASGQVRVTAASVVSAPKLLQDPVAIVRKIRATAAEVGGMRKLLALIEALSDR